MYANPETSIDGIANVAYEMSRDRPIFQFAG